MSLLNPYTALAGTALTKHEIISIYQILFSNICGNMPSFKSHLSKVIIQKSIINKIKVLRYSADMRGGIAESCADHAITTHTGKQGGKVLPQISEAEEIIVRFYSCGVRVLRTLAKGSGEKAYEKDESCSIFCTNCINCSCRYYL